MLADAASLVAARQQMAFPLAVHILLVPFGIALDQRGRLEEGMAIVGDTLPTPNTPPNKPRSEP